MNKREAGALRKQRLAQIDRAFAWWYEEGIARFGDPEMFEYGLRRERDRQIRLAQDEYKRNIAPRPRKSTRETRTSRFWTYFGQDGRPVAPWETEAGPQVDDEDDEDTGLWAAGDYGYEDFDTDWGGYDYVDTGYDDENA